MPESAPRSVGESVKEYGRGIVGGLLFSLPLLYTMEVWWSGFMAGPLKLLAGLAICYMLLLGYNRFAGMRRDAELREIATESVEELGIGISLSALILFILGRIGPGMAAEEVLGKILVESFVVAIGVSVGTAQLGETSERDEESDEQRRERNTLLGRMVLSICGAVLIAANVAPTEEILMLGVEMSSLQLLGLLGLSLFLTWMVLHGSGFRGGSDRGNGMSLGKEVASAGAAYVAAVAVSVGMLWFFGRLDGVAPIVGLDQTVVLALPASLGSSVGRLLVHE
ncbi:MAG TPA: TIGR02587 family membrane protein [Fimbriimonadaceae bacterium]|nr:TIGR02587 family membrane protein [Fimbriimonadaceae bacterium]